MKTEKQIMLERELTKKRFKLKVVSIFIGVMFLMMTYGEFMYRIFTKLLIEE